MRTEIRRGRTGRPRREQPLAEEHENRDRAEEQWDADERELEVSEGPFASFRRGIGHDHVDHGAR